MDEQQCPRCKTSSYTNPSLRLLVNVCGHKLCQTCVDVLFTRPSAACPECSTPLRRSDFRVQQFEDAIVEREVDIRKRIVKIFNKREEDFLSYPEALRAYNDYLEEIESIIWNLANKIDVEETKKKVEKYKRENETQIRKNNSKISQEESILQSRLEEESKEAEKKRKESILQEVAEQRNRNKEKDSLIDDLMYADAPADEVLARHQLNQALKAEEEKEKRTSFFFTDKSNLSLHSMTGNAATIPNIEAPLFVYEPLVLKHSGPCLPDVKTLFAKGYVTTYACHGGREGCWIYRSVCLPSGLARCIRQSLHVRKKS